MGTGIDAIAQQIDGTRGASAQAAAHGANAATTGETADQAQVLQEHLKGRLKQAKSDTANLQAEAHQTQGTQQMQGGETQKAIGQTGIATGTAMIAAGGASFGTMTAVGLGMVATGTAAVATGTGQVQTGKATCDTGVTCKARGVDLAGQSQTHFAKADQLKNDMEAKKAAAQNAGGDDAAKDMGKQKGYVDLTEISSGSDGGSNTNNAGSGNASAGGTNLKDKDKTVAERLAAGQSDVDAALGLPTETRDAQGNIVNHPAGDNTANNAGVDTNIMKDPASAEALINERMNITTRRQG